MLAIKAGNTEALKALLNEDKFVNLRESLAGPKDLFFEGMMIKRWRYTF